MNSTLMTMKSTFNKVIVVTALLLAFVAFPVDAATFTVTTTTDEFDAASDCTDEDAATTCSLREAFNAFNSDTTEDHTISIPAGRYELEIVNSSGDEDDALEGDLDVNYGSSINEHSLTIEGAGADSTIIDANGIDRVIEVLNGTSPNDFSISGVTLTGGTIGYSGGGILVGSFGSVLLDSMIITDNTGPIGAGVNMQLSSADAVIRDSIISENVGTNAGGLYVVGGDSLTIENSQISSNEGNIGGAWLRDVLEVDIQDSVIDSNQGAINTGGIATEDCGVVRIENSLFYDNYGIKGAMRHTANSEDTEVFLNFNTIVDNTTNEAYSVSQRTSAFSAEMIGTPTGSLNVSIRGNIITSTDESNGCIERAGATITTDGYNIENGDTCSLNASGTDMVDQDPGLADSVEALGGTYPVYALDTDSVAVDAVPAESCLGTDGSALASDIRGLDRPEDGSCDIGSYELDQTAPVITIAAGTDTIECAVDTWSNAGASVSDNFDATVTVSSSGSITNTTLGEQTITYTSSADFDGNLGTATRTVTVQDTIAPTVSLIGDSSIELTRGQTYTEQSATTSDSCDSEVTVTTSGTVDTSSTGTYTVTYTSTDDSGNVGTATRTITVVSNNASSGAGDGSGDTKSSLGAVGSIKALSNNRVRVNYGDGDQKIFKLFPKGSADAKVQLHTNGEVLIAINKTSIRTYNAYTGKRLASKKLLKKKQYKTKFKRWNLYKANSQNNVMVLTQPKKAKKKQFKLRSFVVKSGGKIVRRNVEAVTTNKKVKNFSKLAIKKNKKNGKKARVRVTKNGKTVAGTKYRVTKKKGKLKQ